MKALTKSTYWYSLLKIFCALVGTVVINKSEHTSNELLLHKGCLSTLGEKHENIQKQTEY